jgi:hypothetical protein
MTMRKLLLNCDQVFDVLTRGPFPTGDESDEAVERHLRACHECRQLAEALQPAVELLHESLAREDATDLPEYQGVLAAVERSVATAEAARPRRLAVRRLARSTPSDPERFTLVGLAQWAVALVLLAAVGSLAWNVISTSKQTRPSDLLAGVLLPSGPQTLVRLDDRGLMTLTSLNLPARCFPGDALIETSAPKAEAVPLPAINQEALRCCTECHRAGQPRPDLRTVAAMQRSCVACHAL